MEVYKRLAIEALVGRADLIEPAQAGMFIFTYVTYEFHGTAVLARVAYSHRVRIARAQRELVIVMNIAAATVVLVSTAIILALVLCSKAKQRYLVRLI